MADTTNADAYRELLNLCWWTLKDLIDYSGVEQGSELSAILGGCIDKIETLQEENENAD